VFAVIVLNRSEETAVVSVEGSFGPFDSDDQALDWIDEQDLADPRGPRFAVVEELRTP
jgi:hypothetical protein